MSTKTNEILELLKALTLSEATELISQIEETFGISASAPAGSVTSLPQVGLSNAAEPVEEKTTFDVILEDIASDKRVAVLKVIRNLTSLGLKEAKDFTTSLPKAVKEGTSKELAEAAKQQLELAGGKVKIN